MRFRNRAEAGRRLADALLQYRDADGIVYPLPRGGIVLGVEIARALHMPLDLVIPRKIGHPGNPEYALCAVSENGEIVCNEGQLGTVAQAWLNQQVRLARDEARRRRDLYLGGRTPLDAKGRTAIIVDDGIATGLTMRAAINDVRRRQPTHIVVAVPVIPSETAELLRRETDDVVGLDVTSFYLGAVGAYYEDFDQVGDEEVIALLRSVDQ